MNSIANSLIEELTESTSTEIRMRILKNLKEEIERQAGLLLISNLKKLFNALELCLKDDSLDVVFTVLQFLNQLLQSPDPDTEINFVRIIPSLIANMGDTNVKTIHISIPQCIFH
jgi:hypothetical protein